MFSRSGLQSRELSTAAEQRTRPGKDTHRTKSTGHRRSQQMLVDNGVNSDHEDTDDGGTASPLDSWEDGQWLAQPPHSLSPSHRAEELSKQLKRADAQAGREQRVCESVLPALEGMLVDGRDNSKAGPFSNLKHLNNRSLMQDEPDLRYSSRPGQSSDGIRSTLRLCTTPSAQDDQPLAPAILMEVNSPDNLTAMAEQQARFSGAPEREGMRSLHTYLDWLNDYDPVGINKPLPA